MKVVGTPAIRAFTTSDREEESLIIAGRRNKASNLNSNERPGADVFTLHRKGGLLIIGTWNVRTLNQLEKLDNAIMEMKKHSLNIMGLSEMRWTESGNMTKNGYLVLYSGRGKHI